MLNLLCDICGAAIGTPDHISGDQFCQMRAKGIIKIEFEAYQDEIEAIAGGIMEDAFIFDDESQYTMDEVMTIARDVASVHPWVLSEQVTLERMVDNIRELLAEEESL